MTEQAKSEVKLSRAQEFENILFAMGMVGNMLTGAFWLINVWRYQFALWNAPGAHGARPGLFIPKWPHTVTLFCGAAPGGILASLDAYAIKHHVMHMAWEVEGNTVGLMVAVWFPYGQWQRADSILFHNQNGFVVVSMPGELRAYDFQPYEDRPMKRPSAHPTKTKSAKLGKTFN